MKVGTGSIVPSAVSPTPVSKPSFHTGCIGTKQANVPRVQTTVNQERVQSVGEGFFKRGPSWRTHPIMIILISEMRLKFYNSGTSSYCSRTPDPHRGSIRDHTGDIQREAQLYSFWGNEAMQGFPLQREQLE